ncbi:MAG: DNA repair protein RecO [Salinivirgaceae bacterium]|jgi:DNA repair protein RecO (recombination protein O)|nr:DNA repair protein RecO [Salinivirgaceae bacterium]
MLTQTSIIVLSYTKYSESSIIVQGISEHFGRISFLVYGIGSKKSRSKLASFQPLFLIDTQIYSKASRGIQKIKEFKLSPPLYNLTADIRKSTLSLFIAELLSKTVKEEYTDESLFQFIKTSILFLDELKENLAIFHLVFLLKLSRYLGFAPESYTTNALFFDYKEGASQSSKPYHQHYLNKSDFQELLKLLNIDFDKLHEIHISKSLRDHLLEAIMNMYEIHILNFRSLNSYVVLKEVFSA